MKRILFFAVLALCIVLCPVSAAASIPSQTEYFYANDFAGVLSNDTINYIVEANEKLYAGTGAQIVVATVNFINGTDMEKYSLEMFNSWQIGSAEKNNGLLLLLSIGDDDYYVQTGAGLSISSGEIQSVLNDYLEPYFAVGDYDAGVIAAFDQFLAKIERLYVNSYSTPSAAGSVGGNISGGNALQNYNESRNISSSTSFFDVVWGFMRMAFTIIVVIIILAILFSSSSRRRRHYGGTYVPPPPRRTLFWGLGRHHHHHHHTPHHPPMHRSPAPRPSSPPPKPPTSGFGNSHRSGGGGFSRGGGVGRSSGGGFGGGGSSRPSGLGGGSRSGGGGFSRGGGVGRK